MFNLPNFKDNLKAGLTVCLVSLPLSISLSVAANATPTMGVITAVWAGLMAAIFGGSHHNIVGPTGALSGLLALYAATFGVNVLPVLAIISGLLCLLFWVFKIDKYIIFIPSSVIHGFTLGVAFIIALNQLNSIFGLTGIPSHPEFVLNVIESFKHLGETNFIALGLFSFGLIFLFAFLKYIPKIPGAIVLAALGIGLGYLTTNGIISLELQTLYSKFGEISPALIIFPHLAWQNFINIKLIKASLAIAIIAIAETLISAKIAEGMTKIKFSQRREVFGLGLANIFSGLFGGIPATAALARTALNVKSGATHKTSAIINSLSVAIIALLLISYFKYLPMAIVASILVYVAIRMVDIIHFVYFFKYDIKSFWLSVFVAVITIVEDPIMGLLIGSIIALLILVNSQVKGQTEIIINKDKKIIGKTTNADLKDIQKMSGEVLVYRFSGQLDYLNSTSHLELIKNIDKSVKVVILGFRNLHYIDLDGLESMHEIIEHLELSGKKVLISGVNEQLLPHLKHEKWFNEKEETKQIYERTAHALASLGFDVDAKESLEKKVLNNEEQIDNIYAVKTIKKV